MDARVLHRDRFPDRRHLFLCLAVMAAAVVIERYEGHLYICKCGYVRLWVGQVNSPENSQQLTDWYSFSHIIHGFVLFALTRIIGRGKWPIGRCLLLAIVLEASWEVIENSSFVIDRYRQTMSQDYYGDSILNSMSDISFAAAGFFLASVLPVWATVALAIAMELGVAWAIRDNLTLNIIMLIHPFAAIKKWQMAGG